MKHAICRILLPLLLMALLLGCGAPAAEPQTQPTPPPTTEATQPESTACPHSWTDGVCTLCGEVCTHTWLDGLCTDCLFSCSHTAHDPRTRLCTLCSAPVRHDFREDSCTRCSLRTTVIDTDVPAELREPSEQAGTVERVYYDTYAYAVQWVAGLEEDALPVEKYAYVYLPYGYDPHTQYDVLYLMHGMGGAAETWFGLERENRELRPDDCFRYTTNMLDNLIAAGEVNPLIVVSTSYYTYVPKGSTYAWANGDSSQNSPAVGLYALELPQLVEAVEGKYAAYAHGDTSRENLHDSRAHRAFAGFSQGSAITFQSVLAKHLDIFGYLGNLSGAWTSADFIQNVLLNTFPNEEILYWYHGNGYQDSAHGDHLTAYRFLLQNNPGRLEEGVNICMVDKPDFAHNSRNWSVDLYNMLHLFFLRPQG